ncbi:hypothetical protein BC941DRAFT_455435 [Chlamydoabsidia padenii]|nr:hypothetical protein BC941DRAFT_455435 [Chlamydoabsidia padenii]
MATTALLYDPLLFYPYAKTYYEAGEHYAMNETDYSSAESCIGPPSLSSSPSSPSTNSIQPSSPCGGNLNQKHVDTDWNHIMSNIKKDMYNSTSAAVPSPVTYLCENVPFKPKPSKDPAFFYNSDIADVKDMYSYRQLRSENLLYRMFNCPLMKMDVDQTSVMRLTKGIFIANKLQPSTGSPMMAPIDLLDTSFTQDEASVDTIDTFHSGNMKQFMLQQQQQPIINNHSLHHQQRFVPFSYTFGARFSNPYHGRDIVLRAGQLPLWCQTLFLNECVNRMPLKPDVPYPGLFPFAPTFIVIFRTGAALSSSNNNNNSSSYYNNQDYHPDLTFIYERYAMELSEPNYIMDNTGAMWTDQKQQVMNQLLFCDIPDDVAEVLTQLANLWATDQCLTF